MELRIAGFKIHVQFQNSEWRGLKKEYINQIEKMFRPFIFRAEPNPDAIIVIKDQNKIFTMRKNIDQKNQYFINTFIKISNTHFITFYQHSLIGVFQMILKYILIDLLYKNQGFGLHCSAVLIKNKAQIFRAKSGGGKSTILNLLKSVYKPIVDDFGIVKLINNNYYFYHSKFLEKQNFKRENQYYEIGNLFIIKKSSFNGITQASDDIINSKILEQAIFLTNSMIKIDIILKLTKKYPVKFLFFSKDRLKLRNVLRKFDN